MSLDDDKWQRREARIRGSGTRELNIDDFNIDLPDSSRQEKRLKFPDSALVNPEDYPDRQRLREQIPKSPQLQPFKKVSSQPISGLRQENRKLTFSSDDDDEEDDEEEEKKRYQVPDLAQNHLETVTNEPSNREPEFLYEAPDLDLDAEEGHMEYIRSEKSDTETPDTEIPDTDSTDIEKKANAFQNVKRELSNNTPLPRVDTKRRRGRPRKEEKEAKATTATVAAMRRSRRFVDNPASRQAHVSDALKLGNPKPLTVSALASLLTHRLGNVQDTKEKALSLTAKTNGKQKGMVVDAQRVYTASTRSRRTQINTLDVILQLVEEHTPRPNINDIINESQVLIEFKFFLRNNLIALMDQHATILDVTQDIADIQRKKDDVRRSILDLKKKHAAVGTELAKGRKSFADTKAEHMEFMTMANSLKKLKSDVLKSSDTYADNLTRASEPLIDSLDEMSRLIHPQRGLQAQLQNINNRLAEYISKQ